MPIVDYELFEGFLWPVDDVHGRKAIFGSLKDLDGVYRHVTDFSACVQAGGNCGVWPFHMAERFDAVYTFEPDAANFHCLAYNCTDDNIIKLQAAIGNASTPVGMKGRPQNCGAHQIDGDGIIPVIAVDSLQLPSCGLIYLDIEGYEGNALRGAEETIARCKPIIAIENKGHSDAYGQSRAGIEKQVKAYGYEVVERPHRDVVFRPL